MRSTPGDHLFRPLYVIQMNWRRMSAGARLSWAKQLRDAALNTIQDCDLYIVMHDPTVKWVPLDQWKPQP